MKHLKKYNESSNMDENLLEELTDMFKTHFLDISDETSVNMFYSYYHNRYENVSDENQMVVRVDFTYSYKDVKNNLDNLPPYWFNKFVDDNTQNFRLMFHAGFSALPSRDKGYIADDGTYKSTRSIQGDTQLGEPIIDVDEVCKNMKFIVEQLPMIVNRLKDEFEEVIVNVSTIGSSFEISAFCDKETTKKVGIIPALVQNSKVYIK
jgi:hypothetical protein